MVGSAYVCQPNLVSPYCLDSPAYEELTGDEIDLP